MWRDKECNRYTAERASNGRWVCMRINEGGNRKCVRQIGSFSNVVRCRTALDAYAKERDWDEVPE